MVSKIDAKNKKLQEVVADPQAFGYRFPRFTASEEAGAQTLEIQSGAAGWDDFVLDFSEFAAKHQGVPFFNQTRNAPPEVVNQRFGTRLAFFNKVRRELDPTDRLVNQFFQAYLPQA